MHEDIYRQKLQQFVANGQLSKDETKALVAFQVRLCIPQEAVDAAHAGIRGLFAKAMYFMVINEAIVLVNGYDADRREAVWKAAQSLNLKKEAAMTIFSKAWFWKEDYDHSCGVKGQSDNAAAAGPQSRGLPWQVSKARLSFSIWSAVGPVNSQSSSMSKTAGTPASNGH